MAQIRPFAAVRYAPDAAADLSRVTCPPYDVLSPQERQALIARSPYAAARLILPEGEGAARYENARELWRTWLASGVLRHDATPGFYVTRTHFVEPGRSSSKGGEGAGGERQSRLGLLCLLRLHPYSDRVVLPHEHTLSKPKEDRLNLLRATYANFESIMGLVDDADQSLYQALQATTQSGVAPLADFEGDDEQRHTLFKVEDPGTIAALAARVASEPVYIADGHHRYETSVAFAQERGALGTDRPEAFLLTTLLSSADPGLALLPTHRLVRDVPSDRKASIFRHLSEHFDVREISLEELTGRLRYPIVNEPTFGLVLPSGTVYQVSARDLPSVEAALPPGLSPTLRRLDVTIAQHLILDAVFGLPAAETATTDRLAYTRDADEAVRRVHDGEFDAALLLGHTPVEAVRDVSQAGEVMPQKSTFFYPKLLSGLVLRDMSAAA
jgi:uncharacterized protein (DUF1015 family)